MNHAGVEGMTRQYVSVFTVLQQWRRHGITAKTMAKVIEVQPHRAAELLDWLVERDFARRRRIGVRDDEEKSPIFLYFPDPEPPPVSRIEEILRRHWGESKSAQGARRHYDATALLAQWVAARGIDDEMPA